MNARLRQLIDEMKVETFTDPSTASDEDALGILVSQAFEWDGAAILRVAYYALEDANFHTETERVDEMHRELTGVGVEDTRPGLDWARKGRNGDSTA